MVRIPYSRRVGSWRRPCPGAWRCEKGAAAVEFALVLPVLCFLLLGTLQGGLVLGVAHALEQISASSGRYAMVGLDARERQTMAEGRVRAEADRYAMIRADRLETTTAEDGDGAFTVTLSYDASYLPQIAFLGSAIGMPATIRRSATMLLP